MQGGAGPLERDVLAAVRSVLGSGDPFIPLHEPEFRGDEAKYVLDCIETGWVSSVGSYVTRFEDQLARAFDVEHAVATSTGTAALHVCLLLAGVKAGDEVLTPTLTFVATANAVSYIGATPHFVDAECRSLGVDASSLDGYLAEATKRESDATVNRVTGRPVRALIVTHVFGHPADLDGLAAVAEKYGLVLVEDAAESLGSEYKGSPTGRAGRVSAVSFNGNKTVTTGGGGAILTRDNRLADRARHLTTTARIQHRWGYVHDEIGFNYRLPNLNAALGVAQLEALPGMLERKRLLAERYEEAFRSVHGITFLREPPNARSNYWLNAIVLDVDKSNHRDDLLATLNDAGYMARPLWTAMHRLQMYRDLPRMNVHVAESLEQRVINLPSSAHLADSEFHPA